MAFERSDWCPQYGETRCRVTLPGFVLLMNTPLPPMNPEVARLRRQGAQRRYLKGLRYVRGLWAFAGMLLALLLIEVVWVLSCSPRFWVYRIQVTGVETLTPAEVIRLAAVPKESNFYRTSLHDIAERVCTEPRVDRVTVRRMSVGVLEINARERQPLFRLGTILPLRYLDATGHLFSRPRPPRTPVPVVDGLTLPRGSAPGHRVGGKDALAVLDCLNAARQVPKGETPLPITRLLLAANGRITLVLRPGAKVFLGRPGDFARKLWVARHTVVEAKKQGYPLSELAYIDVKVIERATGLGAYFMPKDVPKDMEETGTP